MFIDTVFGVLAPNLCIVCGREGYVMCGECLRTAGEPVVPRCAGCHKISDNFKTCSACRSWLKVESIYVATVYEGIYEQLIKSYKFDVKRQAAEPIATIMSEVFSNNSDSVVLCPVPTAPMRIRERGFDHTKLLARQVGRITGAEVVNLLKRRTNVRQLGSSRSQRLKQMEQEFYTDRSSMVEGKDILLVDDVVTTGATLSAAAKILKSAGAKRVRAIVFAQKI